MVLGSAQVKSICKIYKLRCTVRNTHAYVQNIPYTNTIDFNNISSLYYNNIASYVATMQVAGYVS